MQQGGSLREVAWVAVAVAVADCRERWLGSCHARVPGAAGRQDYQ